MSHLILCSQKLKKSGPYSCFTHTVIVSNLNISSNYAVIQSIRLPVTRIDFSMNYTLIRQCEVQKGFFSQYQATLFTIHLAIGQEQRNLAIISNYMEHTTACIYCTQQILIQFINKKFPLVKLISYLGYISSILHTRDLSSFCVLSEFFSPLLMVQVVTLRTMSAY